MKTNTDERIEIEPQDFVLCLGVCVAGNHECKFGLSPNPKPIFQFLQNPKPRSPPYTLPVPQATRVSNASVAYSFHPVGCRLVSDRRDPIKRVVLAPLFTSQADDLEAPLSVSANNTPLRHDNLAPFEEAYEHADSKDMDMDAWPSDDEGNDKDDIAIEVDDLAPATSTSTLDVSGDPLEEHAAITSAANEFTELNEFESWVLERIHRAHSKGNSAVKGLRELQMRSIALADENARLNARLNTNSV
ncbi:hypothetical protein B0H14DRAFT_2642404 [Mycena olivaceomarginata]|nr:hypothetical protein B0H14DRAFT_2642404 [Mycena olivaceomarginata]